MKSLFKNKLSSFVTIIALALSLVGSNSQASTFKRFWRGYQKTEISTQQFVDLINGRIIPGTRDLFSKPAGLISYQPVISDLRSTSASPLIAQEFALLDYESEEIYLAFRATSEGQDYTNLHWEMFDKTRSKSSVVEPYKGLIEFTHAYDLIGEDINWKNTQTHFSIHHREAGISQSDYEESLKNYFDELKGTATSWGLKGAIVLVMEDHIAVYEAWTNRQSRQEYLEALDSDMPTGSLMLSDTTSQTMGTDIQQRSSAIDPGEGKKLVRK